MLLFAIAFVPFACAADNTQIQALAPGSEAAAAEATESTPKAQYTVECGHTNEDGEPFCYVDRDTYVGWRTFHAFCHVCHAQDAVGSTFAPNLLERMLESDMTRELFIERLNEGFTGQVGVMPPWKDNPNVRKRYNELFAYLMARASGALPPGRPKRKPKTE